MFTCKKRTLVLVVMICCLGLVLGCAQKKTRVKVDEDISPDTSMDTTPSDEDVAVDDIHQEEVIETGEYRDAQGLLEDVFFALDRYSLGDEGKFKLDRNITWLQENPRTMVLIEGHCCDLGTEEYNLSLGDRRANAVRDYFILNGIDPSRLKTISYGEMKPFVLGRTESARSKNRRAHFKIQM